MDVVHAIHLRIYFSQVAMREAHLQILEDAKEIVSNIQQQARWACRGWAQTLGGIFAVLADVAVFKRLSLDGGKKSDNEHTAETQSQDATFFFDLMVSAAAQRAWSMMVWELPPHQWLGILNEAQQDARNAFTRMKNQAFWVRKAWEGQSHPETQDAEAR